MTAIAVRVLEPDLTDRRDNSARAGSEGGAGQSDLPVANGYAVHLDPISRRAPVGLPCQVGDADLWFAETPVELELAKSLCVGCPALTACLVGALERREPCGVWGGEIFERGSIVARKRPRGRPRKDDRGIAA